MRTRDVELGAFAHPDAGTHPGVVLVHDVWGLGDHARDLTQRLASEGFAVLGVDLYRRQEAVTIDNPGAWMRALSDPQILSDLDAAARFLREDDATAAGPVGVVGFCMGGMYALLAACGVRGIGAAVAFYGLLSHEHGILYDEAGLDPARKPRQPLDAVREIACPLLALYGDRDEFVPLSDVEELRRRLKNAPTPGEVVVYPRAGHAFANDTRPEAYRADATADAWTRTTAFLRRHLAEKSGGAPPIASDQ